MHAHVARSAARAVVVSRDRLEHRATFPHRPVLSLAPAARLRPPRAVRAARTAALAAVAAAARVDLVHVHFGYAVHDVLGLLALAERRRRPLPLVLSLHGDDVTALPRRSPGHYDAVAGRVDALVVPSRWLGERAAELGFDRERVQVVPAGVDLALFSPAPLPDGPPVVAFVGRLVDKKGLDVLLDAWPDVRAAVPGATLRVLGDGPRRALLVDPPAGVEHVPPDPARRHLQVRDLLRSASVVCSPSRTTADGDAESLHLVNLEAQATGRPVVTTRHGGIPEYVEEGASALVVPEADAGALAGALVEVLGDRSLAERMAAAGPAVAARHDVAASTARIDDCYRALVGRSAREPRRALRSRGR